MYQVKDINGVWHDISGMEAAAYRAEGAEVRNTFTREDMRRLYDGYHSWGHILKAATDCGTTLNDALSMMEWEFSLDDETLIALREQHEAEEAKKCS